MVLPDLLLAKVVIPDLLLAKVVFPDLLAKVVLPGSWLSRRPGRLLELSAEVPQFTFPWIGDMDAVWKLL